MIFPALAATIVTIVLNYSFNITAAHSDDPSLYQRIILSSDVNGCPQVHCSYCRYTCLFPPDMIDEKEKALLKKHVCKLDFSQCNLFICKRYLLVWNAEYEMYFENNGNFVCYQCKETRNMKGLEGLSEEALDQAKMKPIHN